MAVAAMVVTSLPLHGQGLGGRSLTPPPTSLTIARLQYEPGDWYGNPTSTADREAIVRATDPDLDRYPLLYLTGHGEIRLTDEEVDALRAYLTTGGMLHADDNFGIDPSLRREIARIFPDERLIELPRQHPIFGIRFGLTEGLPKIHEHAGGPPKGYGVFYDGRLVVFYSFNTDLGDGWEDAEVHGDPVDVRRAALEMGANVFVYALTH